MRWANNRPQDRPFIYSVAAFEHDPRVTRSFQLRIPPDVRQLVVDTPAALSAQRLSQFTRGAHAILVPVLPSDMDIHAVSQLVADLLLVAKVSRRMGRLGVIANRVRENTRRLPAPHAVSGVAEHPGGRRSCATARTTCTPSNRGSASTNWPMSQTLKDLESWAPLIGWIEQRMATAADAAGPDVTAVRGDRESALPAPRQRRRASYAGSGPSGSTSDASEKIRSSSRKILSRIATRIHMPLRSWRQYMARGSSSTAGSISGPRGSGCMMIASALSWAEVAGVDAELPVVHGASTRRPCPTRSACA